MKTFVIVYVIGWIGTYLLWVFSDDFREKKTFDAELFGIAALAWWVQWVAVLAYGMVTIEEFVLDFIRRIFKKNA